MKVSDWSDILLKFVWKNNEFDATSREKHTLCLCIYVNEFKGNIAFKKKGVHWIRIMIHILISTTVKKKV